MKCIAITGGTGSGKTSLAISLCKKYPNDFALIHLDDYFKPKEQVPKLESGILNWEHPDAIRFDNLYKDMQTLLEGNPVTLRTKSELYNPRYLEEGKKEYTIQPKQVLVLEGYLALHDSRIRELIDFAIYLDIPIKDSTKRRTANKFAPDQSYFDNVLLPMHDRFVESTKKFAQLIIDTLVKNKEEVFEIAEKEILKIYTPNQLLS